jgi:hypothetical protein
VGRQGRALLLHYVAVVLEADLAARLRVLREAKASDDGGARAAETVLQGALLWRLLQVRAFAGEVNGSHVWQPQLLVGTA